MRRSFDAIVVGARCAGASLALQLARAGRRVCVIERDPPGRDTVSTHVVFPDTLHRLDRLGVLDRLRADHELPWLRYSWRCDGAEVAGTFTPIGGYDRASCVRRFVLDAALADTARDHGAEMRFGMGVTDLIGRGHAADPVRGVVLDDGTRLSAPWVFGADGRTSTVARHVGAIRRDVRHGELAFLFAYWTGMPPTDWLRMDLHDGRVLMSTPCEDGVHLLVLGGDPRLTHGGRAANASRYRAGLQRFPAVLNPRLLDRAEQVSKVVAVPESRMRGFYRRAAGPGWALIGDAGHFKHPSTAQGIGDAIEQAEYVARAVTGADPALGGYEAWRDQRAAGFYEWSYELGRLPAPERTGPLFTGLAADGVAGQQWRDAFCRQVTPGAVHTAGRLARWKAASAYADAQIRLLAVIRSLSPAELDASVPACPGWSVRDVVAHLDGVAEDTAAGRLPDRLSDAWREATAAAVRDAWTATQVKHGASLLIEELIDSWDGSTRSLAARLRRGEGFPDDDPVAVTVAPVDLAVHVQDVRGALGRPGDRSTAATRLAFAVYIAWLDQRLRAAGRPALELTDGQRTWVAGEGPAAATVVGDRFELFRTITGRRAAEQILGLDWCGDPGAYLDIVSPYALPSAALVEPSTPSPSGLHSTSTTER